MYEIVRPFESRAPQSKRRLVASNVKEPVEPAVISWGRSGSIAGAQEIEAIDETGISFTVLSCDDRYEEIERKETTTRVENPDDPNSYVMVARPTYIAFNKLSEWEKANYNKTTTWQTTFETANFVTMNSGNKKCKSGYTLQEL